jgi:hypothetical protein
MVGFVSDGGESRVPDTVVGVATPVTTINPQDNASGGYSITYAQSAACPTL